MAFVLTSPDFKDGDVIPERHARDGGNVSPQLEWGEPPVPTRSFVLILEDPDAPEPAFRHWAVYDISPDRRHLAGGGSSNVNTESLPHAVNDFGNAAYDGPQRPADGSSHTYRFRLAALDVPTLGLEGTPTAAAVWDAAREHILAETGLVGRYAAKA